MESEEKIDEAYKEYVKDGKKSKPISELWKECNL